MNRSNHQQIIDLLSDAVVLLDEEGKAVAHNAGALALFGQPGPSAATLGRLIRRAVNGEIALPHAINPADLDLNRQFASEVVWLIALPQQDRQSAGPTPAYALIAAHETDPSRLSRTDEVMLALIGQETRRDITRMRELLIGFDTSSAVRRESIRLAAHISDLLVDICELAELQQQEGIAGDQRIFVGSMIREITESFGRPNGTKVARYEISLLDAEPSPIYGKSAWIRQALHSLLQLLGNSCPANGIVQISVQQIGDFVIVTGKVKAEIGRATCHSYNEGEAGGPTTLQLSRRRHLQIARRILEIHGGQLRLRTLIGIDQSGDSPIDSFTLSLPTSLPAREKTANKCNDCPVGRQAQHYARDLAELLDAKNRIQERTRS